MDNIEAMKRLASKKVGVTFLPQMAVMSEIKTGELVEIPFCEQHQFTRETFLVYKRRKHTNAAISSFVNVIQEYVKHHLLDTVQ
ncbi:hypothetical protein SD71_01020 [Cohnella kolymensis]|uniref:LysR substrate-binding domain-containing protein n=1 Tax=Cohnella kolymensis TaxID=1590652 RepID=A0ABR5A9E5_9BACL|nr:hypothetical protein SD71_01020 [Cohnella kolymensis]